MDVCVNINCGRYDNKYENNCRCYKKNIDLNICTPDKISVQGFLSKIEDMDISIIPDKKPNYITGAIESKLNKSSNKATLQLKYEITLKLLNNIKLIELIDVYDKTGKTLLRYFREICEQCNLEQVGTVDAHKNELYLKTVQEKYDRLFNNKKIAA